MEQATLQQVTPPEEKALPGGELAPKGKGGRPRGRKDSRRRKVRRASVSGAGSAASKPQPTTPLEALKDVARAGKGLSPHKVPTESDWKPFLERALVYLSVAYV